MGAFFSEVGVEELAALVRCCGEPVDRTAAHGV